MAVEFVGLASSTAALFLKKKSLSTDIENKEIQ